MSYIDYTNPAVAMDYWFKNIAPKYFNFNVAELHRTGIFGYTNEVMSTVENDTAHAVSIARREFYPTTAKYTKSLYKMAALQQISYPLSHAAQATAILLLQESDIINNGTFSNGRYEFTLDNSMTIDAGGIPFMLDYPLKIMAKPITGETIISPGGVPARGRTRYAYTVRYDIHHTNDISRLNSYYIVTRSVTYNGTPYLLVKVSLHQCVETIMTENINKSPILNNINIDFPISGKMCNFEVFYSESEDSSVYQLKKLPLNSNAINDKFCMYSLVDDHTLRITFPENAYFNPKFNSSLTVKVYTTLGSEGNFGSYKGTLICTPHSERYPYNDACVITGQLQGSSIGGVDFPSQDDFRNDVITAYATNKTITTENDLQIYFDSVMTDTRNKVIFQKKRDDVFERLYAAYMIIKDLNGNIVPTNTLTAWIRESEIDSLDTTLGEGVIKPGRVFRYQNEDYKYRNGSLYDIYPTKVTLQDEVNDNTSDFAFTNIFLMQVREWPNSVGYYLNTINDTIGTSPSFFNDDSYLQFNVSDVHVLRNAIHGENFYKLTVSMQPSIINSGFEQLAFMSVEDIEDTELDKVPSEIVAEYNGVVEGFEYRDIDGSGNGGSVYMIIRYIPDIRGVTRETLTKYVEDSNMPNDIDNPDDLRIWIRISAPIQRIEDDYGNLIGFDTLPCYSTILQSGDIFTADSIIATRKIRDNGILRVIAELSDEPNVYVPMTLERYDHDTDSYSFSAYLSTDDVINDTGRLRITNGFCTNVNAKYRDSVSINPTNCNIKISTFVQYDDSNNMKTSELSTNPHNCRYSTYPYVNKHTHTNTFESTDRKLNFMIPFKFIRSVASFDLYANQAEDGTIDNQNEYICEITGMPLIRTNWLRNSGNVFDLVEILRRNYDYLLQIYDLLENNYSIDMKFFNTYGKSRFFRIGIKSDMVTLNKVNIVPKFGVKINMLSPYSEFSERFIAFVKDYIESFNDVTNKGKAIFMMDLITAIKNNFPEIERLEFYGIDNYNVDAAQIIDTMTDEEIRRLEWTEYVPEFINIYCDYYDNKLQPQIEIQILE